MNKLRLSVLWVASVMPLLGGHLGLGAPAVPPCCEGIASPGDCAGKTCSIGSTAKSATPAGQPDDRSELAAYFERVGPDAALWYQHAQTLAGPAFEGRAPGTRGIAWTADYIEFFFSEYGLQPPFATLHWPVSLVSAGTPESYRQTLTIPRGTTGCAGPCTVAKATERIITSPPASTADLRTGPTDTKPIATENVAGALHGMGRLKDEWIIVGGHYDHVGHSGGCSRTPAEAGPLLGADDNASGTAAVLMLARRLSEAYATADPSANLRSILFVAFTAEEAGLLGSRHFVKNSPVPLEKIKTMINLDMVGRLREDRVWLTGFGTAAEYEELLKPVLDQSGLKITTEPGSHSSDQVSFLEAGIPALYLMTGGHDDVHTAADVATALNPAGAAKVLALTERIVMQVASHPRSLRFVEQPAPAAPCCAAGAAEGKPKSSPAGCCSPGAAGSGTPGKGSASKCCG